MLVHALITSIRTSPEPAILLVLHSLDKELADLLGGRSGVAVLAEHNAAQLLLVPVFHLVGLLRLLRCLLIITRIGIQILLGGLALDIHVMTELALAALFAATLLVEETQHGLRIDTEGHFLYLYRLVQVCSLPLGVLGGLLLCLTLELLSSFPLVIGGFVRGRLRLELLNLFLGGTTFFLWEG